MFKKIQRLWNLTRKDPKQLDALLNAPESVVNSIPDEEVKGEYFPLATEKDYQEYQAEQSGMKAWLDRLKNM